MTVKKPASYSVATRQEKHVYRGSSSISKHHLLSWKNLANGAVLAVGFILCTKFVLQGIARRANSSGYLSPDSKAIQDLYYRVKSAASPGENKWNGPATQPEIVPKSSNENVQQDDLQEESQVTNSSTRLAPTAIAIPGGEDSNNTTTNQMGGSSSTAKNSEAQPGAKQKVNEEYSSQVANSTTSSSGKFTVLVGVMIMAYEMKRRDIIRLAYSVQSSEDADFTVRFILGGYQLEPWLEGENATHGDLIVLQCKENLNEGKTFTFFSSLPDMGHHYDYVMKTDDDAYVRFGNLGKHLQPLPRMDLYYGYSLPCDNTEYMATFRVGAGYLLSWDLVVWIRDSPIPRNNTIGTEDMLVGEWFQQGDVAKNRPRSHGLFHDLPEQGEPCAKNLTMESILIHKLKTDERWYEVIAFYNTSTSVKN